MAIVIQNGEAPKRKAWSRGSHKFADVYTAIAKLKPGEWFVWDGAPKHPNGHVKRYAERLEVKNVSAYRSMDGKWIVRRAKDDDFLEESSTTPAPLPRGLKPEEVNPRAKPSQGKRLRASLL